MWLTFKTAFSHGLTSALALLNTGRVRAHPPIRLQCIVCVLHCKPWGRQVQKHCIRLPIQRLAETLFADIAVPGSNTLVELVLLELFTATKTQL
jgi:hypothetical protein